MPPQNGFVRLPALPNPQDPRNFLSDGGFWYTDAVSDFLKLNIDVQPSEIEVNDGYIGDGYGLASEECLNAIRLVAQTEGIFLDPIYTGKAMAGLIDLIEKGRFKSEDKIVFIHTGGIPAIFAYHKEIAR